MRNVLGVIGVTLFVFLTSCDSDPKEYLFLENENLNVIRSFENSLSSNELEGIYHGKAPSNFFPGRDSLDLERSLMFLRSGHEIPLKTTYYFTPDSSVELISYEWNVVQPGMNVQQVDSATALEDKKWNKYERLFYGISEDVGKKYGHVTRGDGKTVKEKSALWDLWEKEVFWELEDKTIELKLVWMPKPGFKHFKILLKVYGFR